MLTGENGILKRAEEAKEETQRATDDEQRKMAMFEAAMNTENTEYTDPKTNEKITIPAGFAPTGILGESTVDEGLVITDSQGNEFVWIPCEYSLEEANGKENAVIYNADDTKGDNRDDEWKKMEYMYNGGTWYDSQPHNEGMTSVTEHHGFFVARYEAGVPENASFYVNEKMTGDQLKYVKGTAKHESGGATGKNVTTENGKNLKPVSKKGNQAWNFITQENAKIVSENMINTADVKSYLIDSHAWNTICRLIQKKYNSDSDKKNVLDSTQWGNYKDNTTTKYEKLKGLWALHNGSASATTASTYTTGIIPSEIVPQGKDGNANTLELATGMSEDFKAYNIYDLAGNMFEWTTEVGPESNESLSGDGANCKGETCSEPFYAVMRGGSFNNSGKEDPVVRANGYFAYGMRRSNDTGFRVVLYWQL